MIERTKEQVELIVPVQAVQGKTEQLRAVLMAMLAPSRAEAGCVFYNLYESHLPGHFIFHELWSTQAVLDAHQQTPHFLRFLEERKGLFAQLAVAHKVRLCE